MPFDANLHLLHVQQTQANSHTLVTITDGPSLLAQLHGPTPLLLYLLVIRLTDVGHYSATLSLEIPGAIFLREELARNLVTTCPPCVCRAVLLLPVSPPPATGYLPLDGVDLRLEACPAPPDSPSPRFAALLNANAPPVIRARARFDGE